MILEKSLLKNKSGIYKFTCLVNNKVYVGQSVSLLRRLQKHLNLKGEMVITKALKKYGINNFSLEILEYATYDKLDDCEKFWIKHYKSAQKEFGYNIKPEGKTSKGVKLSDEAKLNISMGRKLWMKNNPEKVIGTNKKIKEHYNLPEIKIEQSERSKAFYKTEKGKELCKKLGELSKQRKGCVSTCTKSIKRIDLLTNNVINVFNSIAEAARQTEKSEKQIRYALGIGSRGLPPTGEWVFV